MYVKSQTYSFVIFLSEPDSEKTGWRYHQDRIPAFPTVTGRFVICETWSRVVAQRKMAAW